MQAYDSMKSHILVSSEIEIELERLSNELQTFRIVRFIVDDFKLEDAKAVIAEAYISESETKYIILAAQSFNAVSQNSLLKILEEPPKNIKFIIITPSKSTLLPTIRSRLPIIKGKSFSNVKEVKFNLSKVDYVEVFDFLKANTRIKKNEAKQLVEALYFRATVEEKLTLTSLQLESFDRAYRLLELNSRPQSVLAQLVMSFVKER